MYDKTIFTQKTAIRRFIFAIENKLFVEAHELLEEDWKQFKKAGDKKKAKALQGLINGATALALYYVKNKPDGYKKVWPAFERNKNLFDEIELEEIEKFQEAKKLLIDINRKIEL